ncbi:MAG: alkylmercury lyase [Spirochaetales bacterium]|nr:alkylmercury lyase [Spirochaetales bacterium]
MIRFYYFKGCPHADKTWENLKQVGIEEKIPDSEIEKIEVPDEETAKRFNFQGSPTILMNGVDIYTGETPVGFRYCCRVYEFGESRTGVLPTEFIRKKYLEGRRKKEKLSE